MLMQDLIQEVAREEAVYVQPLMLDRETHLISKLMHKNVPLK